MKKFLIIVSFILIGVMGYYTAFGADKIKEKLKIYVEREVQILQANGFAIEDRKIKEQSESFVINYQDPVKISKYLKTKNIEITQEESAEFKGLRVATQITYLDGIYSAISADIYPVTFSKSLMSSATDEEQKVLKKLLDEKRLLVHLDINKLFSSFKGHFKDINTTIESDDSLHILSKGFLFSGDLKEQKLVSSHNSIEKLLMETKSGSRLLLEKFSGNYKQKNLNAYNYSSGYTIDNIVYNDENKIGVHLENISMNSFGKEKQENKELLFTKLLLQIKNANITEPKGKHLFENIDLNLSVDNINIAAIEKMSHLDENDTKGYDDAFQMLFASSPLFKIEDFSIKRLKEPSQQEMVDGFTAKATLTVEKTFDPKMIEQNPFVLLNMVGIDAQMELSQKLYIVLQRRPELTLMTLMFQPHYKQDSVIFDVSYQNGSLKINGKPFL